MRAIEGSSPERRNDLGMNTTELISHWSMSDGSLDLSGRFRSGVDILGAIASRASEDEVQAEPERAPLLLKRADEEHWAPLAPA